MATHFALANLATYTQNVLMEKDIVSNATKYGKADTVSAIEAAVILGVSQATIRNWTKLGRIKAASNSPLMFLAKDIYALRDSLEDQGLLQSRRNKKLSSSNYIPKNYIDTESPNYQTIRSILDRVYDGCYNTHAILSLYAKELLASCSIEAGITTTLLEGLDGACDDKEDAKSAVITKELLLKYIPGEDTLGMLYICLRRLQEKKSTGSYYTPFYVVDRLVSDLDSVTPLKSLSICDPACGTGNFLLRLPNDTPLENIHGQDIDPVAISITRINLALKYRIKTESQLKLLIKNIKTEDFLFNSKKQYDVIIGNPPWGYVYSGEEKARIRDYFKSCDSKRNPESFSLFTERAMDNLDHEGKLSFLLPETILSAGIHRKIRSLILKGSQVTSLSYLGDVFDKVQCPSVILTLKKDKDIDEESHQAKVAFYSSAGNTLTVTKIFPASVSRLDPDNFHLLCDDNTFDLLKQIEDVDHFTLEGNADFALGIVTGSNKTMILDTPKKGYERIIKGKDIEKFRLLPSESYIRFTPKSFQQCAPAELYRAKEKLFYRFIADEPVVAYDSDKTLSLNSANIIIPRVEGYSAEYIMAILNSNVISFYYRNSFKNLKVLRSCLEKLPIVRCSDEEQREIVRLSRAISASKKGSKKAQDLLQELNSKISRLYGFTFPV